MKNRDEKILKYLSDEMTSLEKANFEEDCSKDPDCQKALREMQNLENLVASLPRDKPSADLQMRFDQMLLNEASNSRKVRRLYSLLSKAAIVVILIVAGIGIGQYLSSRQINRLLANINVEKKEMLTLIGSQSASTRIKGVNLSYSIPNIDDEVLNVLQKVLFNDPSTNVQIAAVNVLSEFPDDPRVRKVLTKALLELEDPLIRVSIINLMVEWKDEATLENFQKLLDQEDINKIVKDELYKGIIKII